MNPEVTKLLSDLASKLGTTIEYLWPKLVGHAQAEATAWFWVFVLMGSLLVIAAAACFLYLLLGDGEEGSFFGGILCIGISLVVFLGAATQYADKRFPEAVAIHRLTRR